MFDLAKALAKLFGNREEVQPLRWNRESKHANGHQRPRNFDAKRKARRKMAKASRRINRMLK